MNARLRLFSIVDALCCAVLVALLLLDRVRPDLNLFLSEPVKWLTLAVCLVAATCAIALIRLRARRRKRR